MPVRTIAAAALLATACAAPPSARAADNVTGTMLVANKRGNSLARINLATGEKTHEVATCANPHELAVSPDRTHVALACYSGQDLEILRTADLGLVRRIELAQGARPHGVFWHANGTLFASAEGRGSIFVVEEPLTDGTRVREIGSGAPGPHMVVVDEAGAIAWGTIIDPATLEIEAEVASGPVPIRVAAHPGGKWVVSSNFGEGGLSVIDTSANAVTRSVRVSGDPGPQQVTLVFSADGERLYAAETATQTVAEVDFATGTVLRRLPSGDGGDGLAVFE